MSNRIRRSHEEKQLAALPARAIDRAAGVPTELSDRRSVSLLAMFAFDEPEDPRLVSPLDGEISAFLPAACTETWNRKRT